MVPLAESRSALPSAQVVTYLLEKGRVSHVAPGERTFHAFYYLAAAAAKAHARADESWRHEGWLCDVSAAGLNSGSPPFRILCAQEKQGQQSAADVEGESTGFDDTQVTTWSELHQEVDGALAALGATEVERREAWGIMSAILALGEIDFEQDAAEQDKPGENTDEDKAVLVEASNDAVAAAATGLGVNIDALSKRLLSRTVHTGRGSNYVIRYNVPAARACRDGLSHELYDRLFRWVVTVVNRSLSAHTETDTAAARSIAILDIFGFEALETNSLEQLLINHTNERLQLFFLHQTLHVRTVPQPARITSFGRPLWGVWGLGMAALSSVYPA